MMKLYSADLSPYSARVRMQIYANGITDIVFELPEHWGMPKFRERFPIAAVKWSGSWPWQPRHRRRRMREIDGLRIAQKRGTTQLRHDAQQIGRTKRNLAA